MNTLNNFTNISPGFIAEAAKKYGTPFYLYDEALLTEKCQAVLAMPNAYGLNIRYAMKANSNRTLLQVIHGQGIGIDASSLNEAKRAHLAGIPLSQIMLTTQEVPDLEERQDLEQMIAGGMKYNVCSIRQLKEIIPFAKTHKTGLSIRVHPGVGAGESTSRNTGDEYSCFGVHLSDLAKALQLAKENGVKFTQVHTHIGSGGDPELWRSNIDLELGFIEQYFPDADTVSFGGGLKEARMPGEACADIESLGQYAKEKITAFYQKTGRRLTMEVEPGTYLMANAGYIVTKAIDKKQTGDNGFHFLILDGGMDVNTRPAMYGSVHPFYAVSQDGLLLSSDFSPIPETVRSYCAVIVGCCCESGDSQCLDSQGTIQPRNIAEPSIGDYIVIGGAGAYCSSMSPFNYNSHVQIPELLYTKEGCGQLIRRKQTLEQMIANEVI